jgi:hypothetical protein
MEKPKELDFSVEKIKSGVDEVVLREVVNEMLAEEGRRGKIRDGFLWRAILLYNEKIGVTIKDEERVKKFCKEVKPVLLKILNESEVKYKIQDEKKEAVSRLSNEEYKKSEHWLRRWEDERENNVIRE